MGFSRQEFWSGLPFPSPGGLPNLGIEPRSPALARGLFTTEPPGKLICKLGGEENSSLPLELTAAGWLCPRVRSHISVPPSHSSCTDGLGKKLLSGFLSFGLFMAEVHYARSQASKEYNVRQVSEEWTDYWLLESTGANPRGPSPGWASKHLLV